jgi:hypothetical protein
MPANLLSRAAILMALLVVLVIGSWELYLRYTGVALSYDNGKELWADKRAMVYAPADKATVFIGSSRIKFDLDIDTWEKVTGRKAIQLAVEGTSPVPALEDFGNDPKFKGKLVVDVMEGLFFSPGGAGNGKDQRENIAYYKSRTPAQRASFVLDHALESRFVFLDNEFLSVNAVLDKLNIPNRPGVAAFPIFPIEFSSCSFDRQNKMADKFLTDTSLQHQVQNIWVFIMKAGMMAPHDGPSPVPGILQKVKNAVDKIRARGGEVVFVRTPCSGPMREGENHAFPRAALWDVLLATTHCPGIYYSDYPATDHFVCPEWSHLRPSDAVLYTKALIGELPKSFVE